MPKKCLGQKQYLQGEIKEKMFNPTLMNKLIRIELVSECRSTNSTAFEAHGMTYVIHGQLMELLMSSMSKNEEK